MLKRYPKIEDIGVEAHVNSQYADKGGYSELEKRLELNEPLTVIARAFGVHINTIRKWVDVLKKEQGNA